MKLSLVFVLVLRFGNCRHDFLDDLYERVTNPTTSGSLVALNKCGEDGYGPPRICVPYYRCDPKTNTVVPETVIIYGETVIDARMQNNYCENILDVCCKLPSEYGTSTTDEPFTNPPPYEPNIPYENQCGIRNVNGVDFRITGDGSKANFAEFPWMVEVIAQRGNRNFGLCGGSLITLEVALTAAHCVYSSRSEDSLRVRAGEWDTQSERERIPYQERDVVNIVVHPRFNEKNLHNDPALLILNTPYNRARNLGTICLPRQGQTFHSRNCIATGWGKDKFGSEGEKQVILKKIKLPILQQMDCQEKLRRTRLGKYFTLDPSFICAGSEKGHDTCTGDGGSPLVCQHPTNPDRYVQAGVVAWGLDCGANDYPGVYVAVSNFRSWIDQQMKRYNIDTKPYTIN